MRTYGTLLLLFALFLSPLFAQIASSSDQEKRTPVLVELFTSEGCSSCPPADDLLGKLERQQPVSDAWVIALGEHVDYWDGLGWKDRFSSSMYTRRQDAYRQHFGLDSAYTPQMVVDGDTQFVGNDSGEALRAIAQAGNQLKSPLSFGVLSMEKSRISGTVTAAPPFPMGQGLVYAALVQPSAVTEVHSGENRGRRLQHVAVVRAITVIGSLDRLHQAPLPFSLSLPEAVGTIGWQVVVFAQRPGPGKVIAIASGAPTS